jgi:hypothetical protein
VLFVLLVAGPLAPTGDDGCVRNASIAPSILRVRAGDARVHVRADADAAVTAIDDAIATRPAHFLSTMLVHLLKEPKQRWKDP